MRVQRLSRSIIRYTRRLDRIAPARINITFNLFPLPPSSRTCVFILHTYERLRINYWPVAIILIKRIKVVYGVGCAIRVAVNILVLRVTIRVLNCDIIFSPVYVG